MFVFKKLAVVFPLLLLAACTADQSRPSSVETKAGALGETISTDHSSYLTGSTITVTYGGLPGNAHDWIAIAPAGSDNTTVLAFVFTNGQTSGTATFSAPAPGSYVARAFANDDYILLAESASFSVTVAPISTDHSTYTSGSTITVTYAGLPGNLHDWIAIAPAGSPNTSVVAFVFTNGQMSGTATFSAPAAGSYVARAFENDDYILFAESASFTVTGMSTATISTDKSSYDTGATITVAYAGLPGNNHDWIAIAPAGSPNTSIVAFVFTNGQTSGTATFSAPGDGSYVARAFANDDYILLAESAAFAVPAAQPGATISTDHATYTSGATITVTYAGLPGNNHDWIAIAPAGSPNTSIVAFVFTNGQISGTATFSAPGDGSYVARAFANDDYILLAESASFTVSAGVNASVSTDNTSYAPGATVTVTYGGLPGNMHDWIAIARADSANTSVVAFVFTNGQTSGTATFTAPASGLYVARAFANDDFILLAESAVFTVCGDTGGTLCFVATMSGSQEVPARTTSASGSATVVFDPNTLAISYQLHHTVVGASAGHIHQAPAGTNGAVIVPFTLVGQGASGTAVLTQAQADDLVAGNLYTNVHSPTFPGGEIRGQLMKPGELLFVANLNQANEVPTPTGSSATGVGSVIFNPATNGIKYRLQHGVSGATAAHIHQAPAGVNGPVIVPFTLIGLGASGTATLTADQATALQTAGCYMNVHSGAFPGGEIRGQLLPPGS